MHEVLTDSPWPGIFNPTIVLDVFRESLMVTFFVMVIMLLIEYITVQSKDAWTKPLNKSPWLQIILAALIGITPGCLGGFTAVSLYVHGIFNFAALLIAMIATFGDEAFVMLSVIPATAFKPILYLLTIFILSGMAFQLFFRSRSFMHRNKIITCKSTRMPRIAFRLPLPGLFRSFGR
jgi:hypothetical protein